MSDEAMETVETQEEFVEETEESTIPEIKIELPEKHDLAALSAIVDTADKNVYGVKTLVTRLGTYIRTATLLTRQWNAVVTSVNTINGVPSKERSKSGKKRSQRNVALKFYESLSTPGLRVQCKGFDLNYDSFDTQEDIIAALVEKHIEVMNGHK